MYTHRDIETFLQLGIKMLLEINIPVNPKVCPKVDFPKAHSFYGMCHKGRPYPGLPAGYNFYIRFSEYALKNSHKCVMNVILHELLHTCPNCQNHQKQWQVYAKKVSETYGYNIQRCDGDATEEDRDNLSKKSKRHLNIVRYNICVECTNCGQKYYRSRESRMTLHPELYTCGTCHGALVRL